MPSRTHPSWLTLAALGVLVLLAHLLVLDTFRGLMRPPSGLHDMAEPMYTRVLLPQEPAAMPLPAARLATPAQPNAPQAVFHEAAPMPVAAASQAAAPKAKPKSPKPAEPSTAQKPLPLPQPHAAPNDPETAPSPPAPKADFDPNWPKSSVPTPADVPTHAELASANPPFGPAAAPESTESPEQLAPRDPMPSDWVSDLMQPANPTGTASASAASTLATEAPITPLPPQPAASGALAAASQSTADLHSPSPSVSASWPPNTRLNYKLGGTYRGELHGKARVTWQTTGNRYQAQVNLDVGFLVSMTLTSQGQLGQQHLMPQVYEEVVRKKRRTITMATDSIQLANGERLPRPAQVQDAASQFIELSHRFASGQQALQVGQQVQFSLARPNRLSQWTYDVVEETELNLPSLGPTRAFLVRPRPSDGDGKGMSAQMWLAPSLSHLPVRILIRLGEDRQVDLMLERIDQSNP